MSESVPPGNRRTFNRRLKEARIGDVAAQYDVALMYANGAGTAKNPEQAFVWTKVAAERGHVSAQYLLGCAFAGGHGTPKDDFQAFKWLAKAQEAGHGKAKLRLAKLLLVNGQSIALALSLAASEQGVADGSFFAAERLSQGNGPFHDSVSVQRLYEMAAHSGNAHAQFELGQRFMASDAKDESHRARQWMRAAAAQGHPGARLALESLDERQNDAPQTVALQSRRTDKERRNRVENWTAFVQKSGRADDAFDLAVMYAQGIGVDRSSRQARIWYRRAAEKGSPKGQYVMGQLLEASDPSQAIPWYRDASEQGNADAQFALAKLLAVSPNVERSVAESWSWMAQAAKNGNSEAMVALSRAAGGEFPLAHRMEFLENAAKNGHIEAQFTLAEKYAQGDGCSRSWSVACRWYQAAAEQNHSLAQCRLAACYARGMGVKKDASMAFAWFERASSQGLPLALWSLGELYATGVGAVEPDPKKAASLCKRAANAGFAPAQSTLGSLFAKAGRFDRAEHWWSLATEQGDPEAMFNLAQLYRAGKGVEQDFERAFELFFRAANSGLRSAQLRVGLAYATGEGVPIDLIEAASWFELAAIKGDQAAKANLSRARELLSPSQAKEASRRVHLSLARKN